MFRMNGKNYVNMPQLKEVNNERFLQELKERVDKKKITEEEIFNVLENPKKAEVITEYKKVDLSNLTAEDWKKACQTLEKDENYQEEIKLWENINDE